MDIGNSKKNFLAAIKDKIAAFLRSDSYNGFLVITALVLLNIVALDYNFRIDLTKDGVYSLSPVSKRAVKNLSEPMKVKVFFSGDLPAPYSNTRLYLQDLMQEYDSQANRLFSYEFMDMSDPEIKKQAEEFGIYPVQITQRTGDEYTASRTYMGLVIIHGDLIEPINELTNTQGLEYRVTTAINKMKGKLNLLTGLEENINLTLYVTDNLKQYSIFPPDIDDQLDKAIEEYVGKVREENSGKIDYEFKTVPASDIDSLVSRFGFTSFSWPEMQIQQGETVPEGQGLIGVLVSSGDKFSALSVGLERGIFGFQLSGLDGIGNRINGAIDSMLSNNPAIGYVTTADTRTFDEQDQQSAHAFQQLISSMYDIKMIDVAKEPVPESVKTLVVNGPKRKLTDTELFRIDNFIMRGGNVLFLVDPFYEILPNQMGGQGQMQQPFYVPLDIDIDTLLETYGVRINRDYVMDKQSFVANQQGMEMPLYFAPIIGTDQLSRESVSTKFLLEMLLVKVSSMELLPDILDNGGIASQELLASSDEAWTMTERITLMPQQIMVPADEELSQYTLGVMLEGVFPSHFADGMPEELQDGDENLTMERAIPKAVAPSKIAVIGTSEITTSQLIDPSGRSSQSPFITNNTIFIQNLIDELNGNESIPQLRSKGLEGSLKDVEEGTRILHKFFNIFGLPVLSIIFGLFVFRSRQVRKKRIQKMFAEVD